MRGRRQTCTVATRGRRMRNSDARVHRRRRHISARSTQMTPSGDTRLDIGSHLSAPARRALDEIELAIYVLDGERRLAWANRVAHALLRSTQSRFLRAIMADDASTHDVVVNGPDARALELRIQSAPLCESGDVVGTLGVALPLRARVRPTTPAAGTDPAPALTPRQREVLHLLCEGLDTRQIAGRLQLADDTVRNHVRGVLSRLGVHSRVEAVVLAS